VAAFLTFVAVVAIVGGVAGAVYGIYESARNHLPPRNQRLWK
jgi:hypothetical protein